jgi:hypothetical protein
MPAIGTWHQSKTLPLITLMTQMGKISFPGFVSGHDFEGQQLAPSN